MAIMATLKQEKTMQILMENDGKSVSAAMKEAGYSDASAKNSHRIKKTQSWEELLEKYLPDKLITRVHSELLEASDVKTKEYSIDTDDAEIKRDIKGIKGTKIIRIKVKTRTIKGESEEYKLVTYIVPLHEQRRLSADMAYKLKGRFAPEKHEHTIYDETDDLSDADLDELIADDTI